MALRAPWQQRYLFGLQTSGITSAVDFATITVLAEVSGKPLLKVTNHPFDLDPGLQFIDQRKAVGQSTRFTGAGGNSEFQIGAGIPIASPEVDATPNLLKQLLWLFFQKGASEAVGTPFVTTFTPYVDADAEVWASLVDLLSTATAGENQAIHGAICSRIELSGDMTAQSIKLTFDLVGASHVVTFDASTALLADPDIAPLLFKNMDFKIGANTINISSFRFSLTNNAASPVYHQATPVKHVLNDLTVEGEFTVPRDSGNAAQDDNQQVTDFKALTDKTLTWFWGASPAASNGDVSFIFNGLINANPSRVADTEIGTTVSFMNVDDGTNDISITVADAVDRGIP